MKSFKTRASAVDGFRPQKGWFRQDRKVRLAKTGDGSLTVTGGGEVGAEGRAGRDGRQKKRRVTLGREIRQRGVQSS